MTDPARSRRVVGIVAIVGSALCLSSATVAVKHLAAGGMSLVTITFGRFLLGALVFSTWFAVRRRRPRPRRWRYILYRAFTNLGAVLSFYGAVSLTTITNANVLNMTYPVWVALLGPLLLREPTRRAQLASLLLAGPGVWLVVSPDFSQPNVGDLVGLGGAVIAGFAILSLRMAAIHDDADTIVLIVMGVGALALSPGAVGAIGLGSRELALWGVASALGIGGQFLLTWGYRFVTAVDGSIASSSRILIAGALGTIFFGDPVTPSLVIGASLIGAAVVVIARAAAPETTRLAGA